MKIGLLLIALVVVGVAAYYIFFKGDKPVDDGPKQQPLAQSKNSDVFNKPFNDMLKTYFSLHDALVNWDSVTAPKIADSLSAQLSKIPYNDLKADTNIVATAKSVSVNTEAEAKGLAGEKNIKEQRLEFNMITDDLYNIIRTVRYDQQVMYHMRCPMAFGADNEGFWLSNTSAIINPYMGNKHPKYHSAMISCGNIQDSLDFRSK